MKTFNNAIIAALLLGILAGHAFASKFHENRVRASNCAIPSASLSKAYIMTSNEE